VQLRDLQTALRQRQFYAGAVEGPDRAEVGPAPESEEKANGMPVTGLATQALLKRLHGAAAEKGSAPRGKPAKS
jgi:hypothetical protein